MDDGQQYITAAAIRSTLGVSASTLRNWAEKGEIAIVRFGGSGKRLYRKSDVERFFKGYIPRAEATAKSVARAKARICYARVSSAPQRDDLERQVAALRAAYPEHEIVRDVGSGINWKRPGLIAILDRAMRGDVQEVVVSHRDRLCRFAFDLVKHVLERAGCRIVVQHAGVDGSTPGTECELRDDLLAIVTCFVASNNGKRAAANRRERTRSRIEKEGKAAAEEEAEAGRDEMHVVAAASDDGAEGDPAPVV